MGSNRVEGDGNDRGRVAKQVNVLKDFQRLALDTYILLLIVYW